LVGDKPGNGLALDLSLVVNTLDGEKDLTKTARLHNVNLEFGCKALAVLNNIVADFIGYRHGCKQEKHGKSVIKISDSIDKGRVSESKDITLTFRTLLVPVDTLFFFFF
jgi:hypothetical protein